jgi:hypothetical protein
MVRASQNPVANVNVTYILIGFCCFCPRYYHSIRRSHYCVHHWRNSHRQCIFHIFPLLPVLICRKIDYWHNREPHLRHPVLQVLFYYEAHFRNPVLQVLFWIPRGQGVWIKLLKCRNFNGRCLDYLNMLVHAHVK